MSGDCVLKRTSSLQNDKTQSTFGKGRSRMRFLNVVLYGGYLASALAAPSPVNTTASNCIGVNALSPQCRPVEANHRREVFYVGGHYQLDPKSKQDVLVDQMYVEKLTPMPSSRQRHPLVFFHGGGYSGAVSNNSDSPTIQCLALITFFIQGMVTDPGWA